MPQRITKEEEEKVFLCRLDVAMGEELALEPPPPTVQLEELGGRVLRGPAVELAQEDLPLSPLGPGPMEVDGTKQAPKDGAAVEDAMGEQANYLPS